MLLLDPLPSISDFQTPLESQKRQRRSGIDIEGTESKVEVQMEMSLPILSRLPPRFPSNKFEASPEDIRSLQSATRRVVSTRNAICAKADQEPGWKAFEADPILALLQVLQLDSEAFFTSLEWALDEISQDSLDDFLISRRMDDWRKLMNDFQIEVPAIGKSLHEFTAFVFDNSTELPAPIQSIVDEVDAGIERIENRLEKAYAALRADMQFSESRRSITEAKTVTKLTELAFIFIPLSFTASLFSMSIHELDNGVPVWTFIVTSLGMALLAYVVRIVLTSEFLAQSSRSALERFWESRGVQRGTSAPVLTISLLTLQAIWRDGGAELAGNAFVVLFIGSFILVPSILAWTTTNLDIGFHVAVFLFLIFSSVALALAVFFGFGDFFGTGAGAAGSDQSSESDVS